MTKIKYDANIMKYMSLFESITRVKLKDCIADDKLTFIVEEGGIGRAIGKNGSNAKYFAFLALSLYDGLYDVEYEKKDICRLCCDDASIVQGLTIHEACHSPIRGQSFGDIQGRCRLATISRE